MIGSHKCCPLCRTNKRMQLVMWPSILVEQKVITDSSEPCPTILKWCSLKWTCPDSTDGLEVLDPLGIFNQIDLTVAVN